MAWRPFGFSTGSAECRSATAPGFDSGSCARKGVGVRVPPAAPHQIRYLQNTRVILHCFDHLIRPSLRRNMCGLGKVLRSASGEPFEPDTGLRSRSGTIPPSLLGRADEVIQ